MSDIIEFTGRRDREEKVILSGGVIQVVGKLTERGTLNNQRLIPNIEAASVEIKREDFIAYNKRYAIAEAVDIALKRIQEDEQLNGKPIVLTIYPQTLEPDLATDSQKLTTTIDVGVSKKMKMLQDTPYDIIE